MSHSNSIFDDDLTLCSALFATGIIIHLVRDKWRKCKEMVTEQSLRLRSEGDAYFRVRYQGMLQAEQRHQTVHYGKCHCSKVQFKVLAPRILHAVDIPSKIRFPRVSVLYQDFELIETDLSVLSMYTVQPQQNEATSSSLLGIYSFCSYCGMQVFYAPSLDPVEIQINLDCLEAKSIEATHIAYLPCPETLPHPSPLSDETDQRGIGYHPRAAMSLLPELGGSSSERSSQGISSESETAATEVLYSSTVKDSTATHFSPIRTIHRDNPRALSHFIATEPLELEEAADSISVMSLDSYDIPPPPLHPHYSYYSSSNTMERPLTSQSFLSEEDSAHSTVVAALGASQASGSAHSSPSSSSYSSSSRKRYAQIHPTAVDYNSYQQMKRYLYHHLDKHQKKENNSKKMKKLPQQEKESSEIPSSSSCFDLEQLQ